jgi:hypothetical protein
MMSEKEIKKFKEAMRPHPPVAPPKDLHPPHTPTPTMMAIAEERARPTLPMGDIDFDAIANSSEFKRFIYYLFTGKVHRGSLQKLDEEIKVYKKVAEDVMETMRGSRTDYREVMRELKDVLAKKREVIEKNEKGS